MAATAATVLAAARARDAARLEQLVCFSFFYFIFFYYTNVYFRSTQCVETGMAATAWARDATRLEPLVCFLLRFFNVLH
jgi:hypothetical protein